MRYVLLMMLMLLPTVSSAEQVRIPWKGDYAHNLEATYSPENKYRSGLSKNFLNGTPEEGGRVQRDGFLTGELIKPKGSTGPVPFIILMHGCAGYTPLVYRWAKEKAKVFLDQGYGVLILDSFATRSVTKVCGDANYHWGWRRAEDAYSALDYLVENKLTLMDEGRSWIGKVYVMGRSNGGTAALQIANSHMVRNHRYGFAGIFAISPGCAGMDKAKFIVPTIIFSGDKDQANDYKACERLKDSGSVRVVLFKGVHHGFEDRTPTYVFNGWRMEHNPKADKDSIEQTLGFMKSKDGFRPGLEIR
jgi:dienelactone hydrolase